jgi:hypothetical protein
MFLHVSYIGWLATRNVARRFDAQMFSSRLTVLVVVDGGCLCLMKQDARV